MNSDIFLELRALAALELELDLLVAEKVAAARHATPPLSWDAIADAAGVSRPSAWRRWNAVVDDPRPTRPLRRNTGQLLSFEASAVVGRLTVELARRTTSRQDSHPWSHAVRVALDRSQRLFEVVQRNARETEYRVRGTRLQITCLEPGETGPGGLSAVTLPSPELSLTGQAPEPRFDQLTTEGLLPVGGEPLVQEVLAFINRQLE